MEIEINYETVIAAFGIFVLLAGIGSVVLFLLANFDLYPSAGSANGYITYQEKTGIFQLEQVCWRDTALSECEVMAPQKGVKYAPGQYNIEYSCRRLCWRWECPSNCRITNATLLNPSVVKQ